MYAAVHADVHDNVLFLFMLKITGTIMIEAIRNVLVANSKPFEPMEVDMTEIKQFIEEECNKRKLDFTKIYPNIAKMNCNIL